MYLPTTYSVLFLPLLFYSAHAAIADECDISPAALQKAGASSDLGCSVEVPDGGKYIPGKSILFTLKSKAPFNEFVAYVTRPHDLKARVGVFRVTEFKSLDAACKAKGIQAAPNAVIGLPAPQRKPTYIRMSWSGVTLPCEHLIAKFVFGAGGKYQIVEKALLCGNEPPPVLGGGEAKADDAKQDAPAEPPKAPEPPAGPPAPAEPKGDEPKAATDNPPEALKQNGPPVDQSATPETLEPEQQQQQQPPAAPPGPGGQPDAAGAPNGPPPPLNGPPPPPNGPPPPAPNAPPPPAPGGPPLAANLPGPPVPAQPAGPGPKPCPHSQPKPCPHSQPKPCKKPPKPCNKPKKPCHMPKKPCNKPKKPCHMAKKPCHMAKKPCNKPGGPAGNLANARAGGIRGPGSSRPMPKTKCASHR